MNDLRKTQDRFLCMKVSMLLDLCNGSDNSESRGAWCQFIVGPLFIHTDFSCSMLSLLDHTAKGFQLPTLMAHQIFPRGSPTWYFLSAWVEKIQHQLIRQLVIENWFQNIGKLFSNCMGLVTVTDELRRGPRQKETGKKGFTQKHCNRDLNTKPNKTQVNATLMRQSTRHRWTY